MATTTTRTHEYGVLHGHEGAGVRIAIGGSAAEALSGLAVLVLAILALAGVQPAMLTPITTIAAGAALMFAGAAIAARYMSIHTAAASETSTEAEMGASMSAEFLGGVAGLVLGILALIGLAPVVLSSVAVTVFGGSILLGSAARAQLGSFDPAAQGHLRQAAFGSAAAEALVGLAAVVLGILALVNFGEAEYVSTLILVGLLVVGSGVLLTGSTLSTRLMRLLTH